MDGPAGAVCGPAGAAVAVAGELARHLGLPAPPAGGAADAHRPHERHGFTTLPAPKAAPAERERMFFYEREL